MAESLSEAESMWHEVDKDMSGTLDQSEVRVVFERLGQTVLVNDAVKLKRAFDGMDTGHDGSVSKEEFLRWWDDQKDKYRKFTVNEAQKKVVAQAKKLRAEGTASSIGQAIALYEQAQRDYRAEDMERSAAKLAKSISKCKADLVHPSPLLR
eukprot:SAG11_NODE_1819_length_4212_cov_12.081935_1_plen_152_part_00